MEFNYELKIPKERVAILIGVKGEVKKELEKLTNTKINVDSHEGYVFITGDDAINLFNARELVKAIGRGFNPEYAKLLLKGDNVLEIVNVNEFAKTKNSSERLKGRVIGKEGKARKLIEDLTECYVSVYGKTVSIIGNISRVLYAKKAIEMILKGSKHSNVYAYLERTTKELILSQKK